MHDKRVVTALSQPPAPLRGCLDRIALMDSQSAVGRFLGRLSPEVAQSFSPAQLEAIRLHFGMRYDPGHAVDIRKSWWIFGRQFYMVLLGGASRRSGA